MSVKNSKTKKPCNIDIVMCFFRGHKFKIINKKESILFKHKETGENVKIWTLKCDRCGKEINKTDVP